MQDSDNYVHCDLGKLNQDVKQFAKGSYKRLDTHKMQNANRD